MSTIQKEIPVSKEIKGLPDREVYKKNYGRPYHLVRLWCIPGIAYYILGIILYRAAGIIIPGVGNIFTGWLVSVWCTGSVAGIPLSFIIAHISFNRMKEDYLVFKKKYFIWHKHLLREKVDGELITKDEEFKVIELSNRSEETKGYFKIKGTIEKTEIRNGKRLKPEIINRITIPKVFTHLNEIYEYPFSENLKADAKIREEEEEKKNKKGRIKRKWQEIKNW